MIFITIVLLIIGLAILIFGADSLVRGASSISKRYGVPPLVIGLTIVAFGTSAPELVINVISAIKDSADIALGNILGSNIANILLILGISALFMDLRVQKSTTWKEIPFAGLSMLILAVMANDVFLDKSFGNFLTRTDGLVLIGFFAIFMYYTFELFKNNLDEDQNDVKVYKMGFSITLVILGMLGLVAGGQLLVTQAVKLATLAGMSEVLVGLTIVAVGTSLPELATSIVAVMKKQTDVAIGNVVGSNIFNVFWILGVTSTITPLAISEEVRADIFINLILMFLLFTFMFIGKKNKLQRWQGLVFVLAYALYILYAVARG